MSESPVLPSSAAEVQAVQTLRAARDVAAAIETQRRALRIAGPERQRRLSSDMLESAERLCNLLDLLDSWAASVSKPMRDALSEGRDELRQHFLGTGLRLVGDRAVRIRDRAAQASGEATVTIGLAARLAASLSGLWTTVDMLGGQSALPEEALAALNEGGVLIDGLAAAEGRIGMFREFPAQATNAA